MLLAHFGADVGSGTFRARLMAATLVISPSWTVPVPARRSGSDRAKHCAWRPGRRPDIDPVGPAPRADGGHRAWLAACRPQTRWEPARVRDQTDRRAGPRTGRGHLGRQRVGDAVEAIMLAVRASVLRFGRDDLGPWERAVWLTGGLRHGRPPLPVRSGRSRFNANASSSTSADVRGITTAGRGTSTWNPPRRYVRIH